MRIKLTFLILGHSFISSSIYDLAVTPTQPNKRMSFTTITSKRISFIFLLSPYPNLFSKTRRYETTCDCLLWFSLQTLILGCESIQIDNVYLHSSPFFFCRRLIFCGTVSFGHNPSPDNSFMIDVIQY